MCNNPRELKEYLDKYVIGQEDAKRGVATTVFNHALRNTVPEESDLFPKNNIMLVGPSGVGKTFMIQKALSVLNVPCYIADATNHTSTGWKGNDVIDIVESLLSAADGSIAEAQRGVIVIDEVDKMRATPNNSGVDINGTGLQQSLLKMIEGAQFQLKCGIIDTTNILFIFSGAFIGLDEIVKKRKGIGQKKKSLGFSNTVIEEEKASEFILKEVIAEDLINYGFMPEFVGRISAIGVLGNLNKDDFKRILTGTEDNILIKYENYFAANGIKLKVKESFIDYIIEESNVTKTGARGLKSVLDKHMLELMYELPGTKIKTYVLESPKEKGAILL